MNQNLADIYPIFRGLVIFFFQYIKPNFNACISKISVPCKVLNLHLKQTPAKHVNVLTMISNLIYEEDFIHNSTYNYRLQERGGLPENRRCLWSPEMASSFWWTPS